MSRKRKSDSAAFKLVLAFVISMAVQSVLMSVILICGGVIKQSRDNSYQIFSEKVNSRADNVEGYIKNVWTNFDQYTNQICQYFTKQNGMDGIERPPVDEILKEMAPIVMDALYYTKTTGAFLILDEEEGGEHAALYFRNANPNLNDEKNSNIYLLTGPWSVSEKMKVVTANDWTFRLNLDDSNRDFYEKPFSSIGLGDDEKLLGYWSPPFHVTPQGGEVITYSVPLRDNHGEPIGVFGVEISVEYLYKFLPAIDLQMKDAYGYIVGIRNGGSDSVNALITHGALQKRLLEGDQPLDLELKDKKNKIYKLKKHKGKNDIYICASKMGMYYNNTPFSDNEWYLIGMMEKSSLLAYPERIKRILVYSFFASLFVGSVVAVVISKWFTKHSRLIELSEVPVGVFEMRSKNNRVHMTNQVSRLLGLSKEQERNFSKSKNRFIEFLEARYPAKEGEDNIYQTDIHGQTGWLRITLKKEEGGAIGIVEDVTDEILQKKTLEMERDYDSLTGIKNRKAFKRLVEEWNDKVTTDTDLCALMFDLNGLKAVNDQFGHDKGDEYICYASGAIRGAFPDSQLFRIGGDEFAAVTTGTQQEIQSCGAVLEAVMMNYQKKNDFLASVAWGYAFYDPKTDENFERVLFRADMNMYENKKWMKEQKEQ